MDSERATGDDPDSDPGADSTPGVDHRRSGFRDAVVLVVGSAVLFSVGVAISEVVPEVGVDVDLKPFFLVYLLIGAASFGVPTLSVALGGALGEGLLDVVEGYELDDPFGFLGYVFGFYVFGWYLHRVASDPTSRRALVVGALLGAFVQAVFEGLAFLIFQPTVAPGQVVLSVLGNTVTHGLVLGAIPLVLLAPLLRTSLRSLLP